MQDGPGPTAVGDLGSRNDYSNQVEWGAPRDITSLSFEDFDQAGEVFRIGQSVYRTTGKTAGQGGMGVAYLIERREDGKRDTERCVAKLYWDQLLEHVEHDETAQAHFQHNVDVLRRLRGIRDIHIMPIYAAEPLGANFLLISPYLGEPLSTLVDLDLSPRQRVAMVLQAVRGLRTLHDHHIVHNDFTPQNILVGDPEKHAAVLFDFDLAVATDMLGEPTYLEHYAERIIGAPEYSVSPEVLDPLLVRQKIRPQRDIYAVGTALWSMFTDASVYGEAPDLASLLRRIADGVVKCGQSYIDFPDEVPRAVRAIITRCLERDPMDRYPSTDALVRDLEVAQQELSQKSRSRFRTTLSYVRPERSVRIGDVIDQRLDPSVSADEIRRAQNVLARYGYVLEKSLGRSKDHPIYVAAPDPNLVVTGRFTGVNTYRKVVTAIDMRPLADADEFAVEWLGCIMPILERVRTEHLTALHQCVVDRPSATLLLFSEHIDDPRFGNALDGQDLSLREALGLGIIVVDQVARLHEHGLAHNNVALSSLMFKGFARTGEAHAFFVGLVDPSFAGEDLLRDVQRLAGIVGGFFGPAALSEAGPDQRRHIQSLSQRLEAVARGTSGVPAIGALERMLGDALAALERNFAVVREHGGDPVGFAGLLVRRALYRRLWASPS